MNQELVRTTPAALTLPEEELKEMQAAFAANITNGSISEFDLPRIKVNTGTALWLVPTLEGEETASSVEGVIVHMRDTRVYYPKEAGKGDAIGNAPPTCSSRNGVVGVGTPGGDCATCPLGQFDSAVDGGGGQACKAVKQLFLLRGSSMFPEIVSLPPTSARPARQWLLKLMTQGIPHFSALVAIGLEKAQNPQGKPYGKAVFKFLRKLTPEETARALQFKSMCEGVAMPVPANEAKNF